VNWLCRAVTLGAVERNGSARNCQTNSALLQRAGRSLWRVGLGCGLGWVDWIHRRPWVGMQIPSENCPTKQFCFLWVS